MYVANINDYLASSQQATTENYFTSDVQFTSNNAGPGVNISYLPNATLMLVCFFIAILLFFFLISLGYALFYYWREPSNSVYASDTDTTFSRGSTPVNPKEICDEPALSNSESNQSTSSESTLKNVVTGTESALRSIVARFFKKKAPEYSDIWHTRVDLDVRQDSFINIDIVALQNAVPLRSPLGDTDF